VLAADAAAGKIANQMQVRVISRRHW